MLRSINHHLNILDPEIFNKEEEEERTKEEKDSKHSELKFSHT